MEELKFGSHAGLWDGFKQFKMVTPEDSTKNSLDFILTDNIWRESIKIYYCPTNNRGHLTSAITDKITHVIIILFVVIVTFIQTISHQNILFIVQRLQKCSELWEMSS